MVMSKEQRDQIIAQHKETISSLQEEIYSLEEQNIIEQEFSKESEIIDIIKKYFDIDIVNKQLRFNEQTKDSHSLEEITFSLPFYIKRGNDHSTPVLLYNTGSKIHYIKIFDALDDLHSQSEKRELLEKRLQNLLVEILEKISESHQS